MLLVALLLGIKLTETLFSIVPHWLEWVARMILPRAVSVLIYDFNCSLASRLEGWAFVSRLLVVEVHNQIVYATQDRLAGVVQARLFIGTNPG